MSSLIIRVHKAHRWLYYESGFSNARRGGPFVHLMVANCLEGEEGYEYH